MARFSSNLDSCCPPAATSLRTDYADELAKLQDRVPPESPEKIRAALEEVYARPLSEVFSEFDPQPAGSASVAQVHRARLAETGEEVAVKILRPGVGARIRRDLRLLYAFAAAAETLLRDGRRLRPRAVIAQFARSLEEETDLRREAANCAQIARNFADAPLLRVPAVYWRWCAKGVMVMSFLEGLPISRIDEFGEVAPPQVAPPQAVADKRGLAKEGIRLFFTQVFRDNFFHADMHPGNVHVDAEGRFILLDFGIVGRLSDFDKEYLLRNFLAFFNRDYRRVAEMHVDAGWTPADTDISAFEAEIRAVCEPVFSQPLRNISFGRFLLQMFQTARKFNLEVQPQLILLQKTLLSVESMGRELDPDFNMWETTKPILEGWMKKQYHPRRAVEMLRKQAPDWFALLADGPLAMRRLLQQAKRGGEKEDEAARRGLRRKLFFWRLTTLLALAAVAALWATG